MSCGPTGLYPPQAAWMVQNEWLWKETFELSSQGWEPHFQQTLLPLGLQSGSWGAEKGSPGTGVLMFKPAWGCFLS